MNAGAIAPDNQRELLWPAACRPPGHPHYRNGFKVALHEDALVLPLRWKRCYGRP